MIYLHDQTDFGASRAPYTWTFDVASEPWVLVDEAAEEGTDGEVADGS